MSAQNSIPSKGGESCARFPTSSVALARADARRAARRRTSASGETKLPRVAGRGRGSRGALGARESRIAVTHRSYRAALLPIGSAGGRDERTREGICVPGRGRGAFFRSRGNDETTKLRGCGWMDAARFVAWLVGFSGFMTRQAGGGFLFGGERLLLRLLSSLEWKSRSKRQAANRRFCNYVKKPPGRVGGDTTLAAAVPPADRDHTPTQPPRAPRHHVGLRQRRRGRLRAHPGQRRVSPLGLFSACFVSRRRMRFSSARAEPKASVVRPIPSRDRSID